MTKTTDRDRRNRIKIVRRLMANASPHELAQLSEVEAANACLEFFPIGRSISLAFIRDVRALAHLAGQVNIHE